MEDLSTHSGPHRPASAIQALVGDLLKGRPDTEKQVLEKAADWASTAHRDQQRASGEPYYSHVLAVAEILRGLNLDYETLAAAMLHDVVEDTDVTLDDVS
jgi:GTP pyrophosphokinase